MDWLVFLAVEEKILWEGCPAPGCYFFRHWRRSFWALAGACPALYFWLFSCHQPLRLPLTVVGVAVAVWFFPGGLLWSRLQWGAVFYAVTDRYLLAVSGRFRRRWVRLPLDSINNIDIVWYGQNLATVTVCGDGGTRLALCCLEHPDHLISILENRHGAGGEKFSAPA
ncbi:MAG: PH domain-containing protein [Desulfuromonadaceae bacterium]|nr:PH domain-containing protein [Desulfuromonadaceae bacterium]